MLTLHRTALHRRLVAGLAAIVIGVACPMASVVPALAQTPPEGGAITAPAPATPPTATPGPEASSASQPASSAPSAVAAPAPADPLVPPMPAPEGVATADAYGNAPEGVQENIAGEQPSIAAQLPHDLSPWGMFMAADWVVKAVMIGLAFASVVTWTIWLAKTLELAYVKRRLRRALKGFLASATLDDARDVEPQGPAGTMLLAVDTELRHSGDLPAEGIKERVAISLGRIEVAAGRAITRGTGMLATIGATAPFVGLFGTVWGIMNSFIGISKAQTTNLAIVAPGIAEALLATAIGLVAAIPAVVIYNHFSRQVSGYRLLLGDASAEVLRLLSRDLDRRDVRARQNVRIRAAAE